MSTPLTSVGKRQLRGRAQLIETTIRLGKAGMSPEFLKAMDCELGRIELVKLRFDAHKDERKQLAPELAAKTGSELICIVGHVAVFYRKRPELAK